MKNKPTYDELIKEIKELQDGTLELMDSFYQVMKTKLTPGDKSRVLASRKEMARRFEERNKRFGDEQT